jgi:electron transfer flavoprotein beta subunit
MKIVVCMKEAVDSSLNLGFGLVSESLLQKGLAFRLNPNDAEALKKALLIKEKHNNAHVEITAISIGPEKVECYLRDALALGADKAVRIQGEELPELSPYQKARVLAKAIELFDADLVLTGAKSIDTASAQVGPFIAAILDIPCVCKVVEFQLENNKNVSASRNIGRGVREKVSTTLPVVLTISGRGENLPYAPLDRVLETASTPITLFSLSDLGISLQEIADDFMRVNRFSFPRPRPKKVPTPDSSLPSFYRILALLQGGILKRQGKILEGETDELVNQLYTLLINEDIIKPVDKKGKPGNVTKNEAG